MAMSTGGLHGIEATATFGLSGGRWRWNVLASERYDGSGNGSQGNEEEALDIESQDYDIVAQASDDLMLALEALTAAVEHWRTTSLEARAGSVEQLRTAGRALTAALFNGRDDEFVRKLNAMALKSININNATNDQVLIDFCVLRDGSTEFFLGERCLCIYRMGNRDAGLINKLLDMPAASGQPLLVGYAEDSALGSACAVHKTPNRPDVEEIYVVGKVAGGIGALAVLDPLDAVFTPKAKTDLFAWLRKRQNVLHFNCHVEHKPLPPRLRVRAGAQFGRPEIEPDRVDLTGTFVFLNACSSVIGGRSIRNSLAEYFRQQGAACVACATGTLDDAFATLFARKVYQELDVNKATIFDAFLESRRKLVQDEGHPMALMYTYLGPDAFVLR